MQHTKAAYVGRLLSALTGLISLIACNQAAPPGSPPPTVTVSKAEEKLVENWSEFTGRTAAVNFVNVTPRVSGYIVDIPFKEGDLLHQGDLLFQIDPRQPPSVNRGLWPQQFGRQRASSTVFAMRELI